MCKVEKKQEGIGQAVGEWGGRKGRRRKKRLRRGSENKMRRA